MYDLHNINPEAKRSKVVLCQTKHRIFLFTFE